MISMGAVYSKHEFKIVTVFLYRGMKTITGLVFFPQSIEGSDYFDPGKSRSTNYDEDFWIDANELAYCNL